MRFTGYGKGWQEEKAKTFSGRVFQILREPAGTASYYGLVIFTVLMAALLLI